MTIIKCLKCGKEFEDNFYRINEFNRRVWCDECVEKKWEKDRELITSKLK